MHEAEYGGLRFDAQRLTARRREGGLIRFTRRERALLLRFHQAPQRLLSRAQLLEALEVAGETSERNIDYLVNRLRAKLGDDAHHPRYIRTRYGEGYVWIAPVEGECVGDAFIAIGPAAAHPKGSVARAFLQALRDHLAACIPTTREVALLESAPARIPGRSIAYLVETGLYREEDGLRGVIALRDGTSLRMLATLRVAVADADVTKFASEVATRIKARIWVQSATHAPDGVPGPSDDPLYVKIVEAERQLSVEPFERMHETAVQIERRRASLQGDEPRLLLERANLLGARQLFALGAAGNMEPATRQAVDAEIESLVMAALPGVQDDPAHLLTAAKLLLRMGPAHRELAQRIVDDQLQSAPAYAGALTLRAQLQMYRGDIDQALTLYDRCLVHAGMDGEFRVYLLVLKVYALLALARLQEARAICDELYTMRPETRLQMDPLFHAETVAAQPPPDPARGLECLHGHLLHAYHMVARHFDRRRHRVEFMRDVIERALAHHGKDGVPAELWTHLPELQPARARRKRREPRGLHLAVRGHNKGHAPEAPAAKVTS